MPILRKAGGGAAAYASGGGRLRGSHCTPRAGAEQKGGTGTTRRGRGSAPRGEEPGGWGSSSNRVASAREAAAWSHPGGALAAPPPPLQSLLASHGPFVGIFRLQPKGKTPVQPVSPQIAPQEQLTSASSRCKDSHVLSLLRNRSQNQRVKPSHSVHGWNKRLFARCGSH